MRDIKRVVLKLSGEALAKDKGFGFDDETIDLICENIKKARDKGLEIAIVVGGGNFWRGRSGQHIERATSDTIGMLGTVMNGLRVQDTLEKMGLETRLMTAINMQEVAEPYIRRRAVRHLEKGRIVIFAAGTGLPYFSTDTTASLRDSTATSLCMDNDMPILAFGIDNPENLVKIVEGKEIGTIVKENFDVR